MNLFDYDVALTQCIDEETGEIDIAKFDALELERDQKIEDLAMLYKECLAKSNAIKEEMGNLKERKDAYDKRAKSIKEYLNSYLAGARFETPKVRISFRKSERLIIAEDAEIDDRWKKASYSIDRAGIKEELKKGSVIEGCSLEVFNNIGIK